MSLTPACDCRSSLDELVARKRALYRALVPPDGGIAREVIALVRAAARLVPVGIVSSAAREEIDEAVRRAGLASTFTTIIGAEDVTRPKPQPDGYRLALSQLIDRRCLTEGLPVLAVEDSPGGTTAARGAGLEVLGVTTTYTASRLRAAGASRTVPNLESLAVADLLG